MNCNAKALRLPNTTSILLVSHKYDKACHCCYFAPLLPSSSAQPSVGPRACMVRCSQPHGRPMCIRITVTSRRYSTASRVKERGGRSARLDRVLSQDGGWVGRRLHGQSPQHTLYEQQNQTLQLLVITRWAFQVIRSHFRRPPRCRRQRATITRPSRHHRSLFSRPHRRANAAIHAREK